MKIRKKSATFWKHGKYKGLAQESVRRNKEKDKEEEQRERRNDFKTPKELFGELGK